MCGEVLVEEAAINDDFIEVTSKNYPCFAVPSTEITLPT